jgi:hypothetical protein
MEDLLNNHFTVHYNLTPTQGLSISLFTEASYFEIEDDSQRELQLHYTIAQGVAAYRNSNARKVAIINYDKFITSLPVVFQQGKRRCDAILTTSDKEYFLLNELKDRKPNSKVRNKAITQLEDSLALLMNVPEISEFASSHPVRHCCFFNKQSMAPGFLNVSPAFNRLNTLTRGGLQMKNSIIEGYGFEFWEFSGNQVYIL